MTKFVSALAALAFLWWYASDKIASLWQFASDWLVMGCLSALVLVGLFVVFASLRQRRLEQKAAREWNEKQAQPRKFVQTPQYAQAPIMMMPPGWGMPQAPTQAGKQAPTYQELPDDQIELL